MVTAKLTRKQLLGVICLTLALVTAALYWPLLHHDFVNLDDEAYITANSHVQSGLTWPGMVWAFQIGYAAYWHPLTWISHMLDSQLYGLNPAGHHLTSLLFHIINALLLFLWLNQLTGAMWRSAFVAALFAWHPLHVESVAWACERKDVLSTFFWMLALIAYTRYVRAVTHDRCQVTRTDSLLSRFTFHVSFFYFLALFFFACGLMSKPMVVTLPFVLLLVDFWPLERFSRFTFHVSHSKEASILNPQSSIQSSTRLVIEKAPFFALALAGSVVTYFAQKGGGAVWSLGLPLHTRLANALVSYLRYISKTFWPVDLAVVYPYPPNWPIALLIVAVLVLAFWTGVLLWRARQSPYLPFGWLWFLGTLVPVIGIVQVGPQSMADRFTYVPGIGLFVLIAWGLNDLVKFRPTWQHIVILAGTAALAGCLVRTRIQSTYWQNSITLLRHAITVTTDNYIACNFLGRALDQAGRNDESLPFYAESVRIESHYPQAQFNLGMAWLNRGRPDVAIGPLDAAVRLVPDNAGARYYLGTALMKGGKLDDAITQFTAAILTNPDFAEAHTQLARVLIKQGKIVEAILHFARVVRLQPDNPEAHFNLGLALLDNHQPAEAAVQFATELHLAPNETRAHYRLAQALHQHGQPADAIRHYLEALRLAPDFTEAKNELDEILAAHPELR
jgi:tetratricopeptide (TPR) repeat protein